MLASTPRFLAAAAGRSESFARLIEAVRRQMQERRATALPSPPSEGRPPRVEQPGRGASRPYPPGQPSTGARRPERDIVEKGDVALQIVNIGRAMRGEPLLTELPPGPPQLPRDPKINATATAAAIIAAGRKARGEIAPALPPKGSIARQIVLAGMRARGERLPEDD
jgi:hypothetical protein